jgi:hypothetical protein
LYSGVKGWLVWLLGGRTPQWCPAFFYGDGRPGGIGHRFSPFSQWRFSLRPKLKPRDFPVRQGTTWWQADLVKRKMALKQITSEQKADRSNPALGRPSRKKKSTYDLPFQSL